MTRFTSLDHAPSETRRLLRVRLQRHLGREPNFHVPTRNGPTLDDEAMLCLLQNLDIRFGDEWFRALAVYDAALAHEGNEPPLQDRVAAGWARVVWGRLTVRHGMMMRLFRPGGINASAFERMLQERSIEEYRLVTNTSLDAGLLHTAQEIERGELRFHDLNCQSPAWVAARLWDRSPSPEDATVALRKWVDQWAALWWPEIVPSQAWDGPAGERFRQTALHLLETEQALEGWDETHARFIREFAAELGKAPEEVSAYIPVPPQTLVDRAFWLDDNRVDRLAQESLQACSDLLGLVGLLLRDIEAQPIALAPHPIGVRLFDLACSRPDVFSSIILTVGRRPCVVADLLLHPPTCALACLIIAQWQSSTGAYDRKLMELDEGRGKIAAFEDALSILVWWLDKGSVAPAEAAALLASLHRRAKHGFIDDLAEQEPLRLLLLDALSPLHAGIFQAMADALAKTFSATNQLDAEFAAALELIALGGLSSQIDPEPFLKVYLDVLGRDEINLSVQRIGIEGAPALFTLAQRMPEFLGQFLDPIDVPTRLAEADLPDRNEYTIAHSIEEALRVHIRVLCRAIAGLENSPPAILTTALISAVRSGAVLHKEKGRVAAFAPRHEVNTLGIQRDRPIAADLAAALSALSGEERQQLLAAILETDEPMMLAQLLPLTSREMRPCISRRIEALPPTYAGTTHSLVEVQARIDELLSAGALDAAAKFIEEEQHLQTFGRVQGRDAARVLYSMRLLFARGAWQEIMDAQPSANLQPVDRDTTDEVLQFYKGLTLLVRPSGRNPEAAEQIFLALARRKPGVPTYTINAIAAQIGALLSDDMFGHLTGDAARRARRILSESDAATNGLAPLNAADRKALAYNQAIVLLALGEPDRALELLPATESTLVDERSQAYRAIAMSRLGRTREAIGIVKAAEDVLGETDLLKAVWENIQKGAPVSGIAEVLSHDNPVIRVKEAYRDLQLLDPHQQAAVVNLNRDPFISFVIEQVRGAAASVTSLVSTMTVVKIDDCEDDVTAIIRELLLSRLDFLRWSSSDQSKGGITPKGNPGERDLLITRGSAILTTIEAVVCRNPIRWETVQGNLKRHFQKLLAYAPCRLFFHLTYVYDQDVRGVIDQLKATATSEAPPGFAYRDLADIELTDNRPSGFVARYNDGQGDLRVVFLALDMEQAALNAAAAASA